MCYFLSDRPATGRTIRARVQVIIVQRLVTPGTQQSWGRPRPRKLSAECPPGSSLAHQKNKHPTHPLTQPSSQASEKTLDGKQPNEVTKPPQQKGESQRRCKEYRELRQCQKAQDEKNNKSSSSSDHRATAGDARHPAELGSATSPEVERRVPPGSVPGTPKQIKKIGKIRKCKNI